MSGPTAAFASWNRRFLGAGSQVTIHRQDWTPHWPGAGTLPCSVCEAELPETSSTVTVWQNPDVQNREIIICWAGNEFHKPGCENLSSSLNFTIPYISWKITKRLNIFLQLPFKAFSIEYDQLTWDILLPWWYITQWCQNPVSVEKSWRLNHTSSSMSCCRAWDFLQKADPICPLKLVNTVMGGKVPSASVNTQKI